MGFCLIEFIQSYFYDCSFFFLTSSFSFVVWMLTRSHAAFVCANKILSVLWSFQLSWVESDRRGPSLGVLSLAGHPPRSGYFIVQFPVRRPGSRPTGRCDSRDETKGRRWSSWNSRRRSLSNPISFDDDFFLFIVVIINLIFVSRMIVEEKEEEWRGNEGREREKRK